MKPYKIIEHTADIGLEIHGKTLPLLFSRSALGLYDLVTDAEKFKARTRAKDGSTVNFRFEADNADELLLKWLRELLFQFSANKLIFTRLSFETVTAKELKAKGNGFVFDPDRDEQRYEVKAVTRHQYSVHKTASGWTAKIIFDI